MKSLPLLCSARPPQEQMKKSENNVERVCVRVCEWWGRRRELRVIVFVVVVLVFVRRRGRGRRCGAHHGGVGSEGYAAL